MTVMKQKDPLRFVSDASTSTTAAVVVDAVAMRKGENLSPGVLVVGGPGKRQKRMRIRKGMEKTWNGDRNGKKRRRRRRRRGKRCDRSKGKEKGE